MKSQRTLFVLLFFLLAFSARSVAQTTEPLFWIAEEPYFSEEFVYAFNKNRQATSASTTEKDLQEYLERYINFRLKVKEAKTLGYHQTPAFIGEMNGYRKQLAKPYLAESLINEEIVLEAYQRTLEEVEASHILINIPNNSLPGDTLAAYNKLVELATSAQNGDSFSELAKQYSQDPSARENSGYLGFFAAFQMVFPFEDVAFKTPVGEVSAPFKTDFGYHIIFVHSKRKALGSVKLAHIFFKNSADSSLAHSKAAEVKERLSKGENWKQLVEKYSDEPSNKNKGGELPWLTFRQLPASFYTATSQLEKGEYAGPLEAQNGWHIIKLIERKPVPPLEEVKSMIESKVAADGRASTRKEQTLDSLIQHVDVEIHPETKAIAAEAIDGRILQGNWSYAASFPALSTQVMTCIDTTLTIEDFLRYAELKQKKTVNQALDSYVDELWTGFLIQSLEALELTQLYRSNANYKFLFNEYYDGTLLFEIMNDKVWQRANTDSIGLKQYFESSSEHYKWGERVEVITAEGQTEVLQKLASASIDTLFLLEKYDQELWRNLDSLEARLNESFGKVASKDLYLAGSKKTLEKLTPRLLDDGLDFRFIDNNSQTNKLEVLSASKSALEEYFNARDSLSLKLTFEILEKDNDLIPKGYWNKGIHVIEDGVFSKALLIKNILQPSQKTLTEIKGKVVADYQEHVDAEWLKELKSKYLIEVNKRAWKNVVKRLNDQ